MQTLKPPKLRAGDAIGIVAPCLPVLPSFREHYVRGKRTLEKMGFTLKEGKTVTLQHGYSAGMPQQQAADINAMFADSTVKALIATSGGFSAIGVLEHLDYDLIRRNPKPFIGMSDMTVYHTALYAKTCLVGFHMDELIFGLGWNWQNDQSVAVEPPIKDLYSRILCDTNALGKLPHKSSLEIWREGRAEGRLIGGTLPLIASLAGTKYFPKLEAFDGAILFWEATGRPKYELRRLLFQLKYCGILDRIGGIAIGTITDVPPISDKEIVEPSIKEIVLEVTDGYDFPIMAGMNFGHFTVNVPMPVGIKARMDTTTQTLELLESAVL